MCDNQLRLFAQIHGSKQPYIHLFIYLFVSFFFCVRMFVHPIAVQFLLAHYFHGFCVFRLMVSFLFFIFSCPFIYPFYNICIMVMLHFFFFFFFKIRIFIYCSHSIHCILLHSLSGTQFFFCFVYSSMLPIIFHGVKCEWLMPFIIFDFFLCFVHSLSLSLSVCVTFLILLLFGCVFSFISSTKFFFSVSVWFFVCSHLSTCCLAISKNIFEFK